MGEDIIIMVKKDSENNEAIKYWARIFLNKVDNRNVSAIKHFFNVKDNLVIGGEKLEKIVDETLKNRYNNYFLYEVQRVMDMDVFNDEKYNRLMSIFAKYRFFELLYVYLNGFFDDILIVGEYSIEKFEDKYETIFE